MPTVFLSSTYEDLKEHRRLIILTLQKLGVTFSAMEYFGTRPERPIEVALASLRECEIYVGIFGTRYGTIDPDLGISITEAEYREAQRLGLTSLMYLIDEDEHPVTSRFVDVGESARKLAHLKALAKSNHLVSFFSSEFELAWKLSLDLPKMLTTPLVRPRNPSDISWFPEPSLLSSEDETTETNSKEATPVGLLLGVEVSSLDSAQPPEIERVAHIPVGGSAVIDVFISEPGVSETQDLVGFQFDLTYDPSILRITSADENPYLQRASRSRVIKFSSSPFEAAGRFTCAAGNFGETKGATGSGTLAQIFVEGIGVGGSLVGLSSIELVDDSQQQMLVRGASNATIVVTPP